MSPVTRREFVCFAGLAAAGAAAGESLTASSESEPQTAGKRSELAVSEAAGASRQATPVRPAQTQPAAAKGQAETQPAALARGTPGQPVLCGSANAIRACDRAIELLRQGGDPVDAVVAGVNIIEDDPHDHSVGYGGLPNEDGVVELDASVMHGPLHRAGAVAALRNIRNPSSVARLVMRWTDHVLLVGEGALRFAKAMGFKEEELLTDEARAIWLKWKATHSADDDWLYPEANEEAERWRRTHHAERQPGAALRGRPDAAVGESGGAIRSATDATARRLRDDGIEFTYGTINCLALTPTGDLGGCTSTSGLSYKLAGRVGDSPIIGAGLYVDNEVGGCG
ncbi:MAG: isoaspartyl peptidase/L-asparaginase, partial [Planctomycetota bacterium]